MTTTLIIKKVETHPLTIKIDCPVAKGYFVGHAKIRNKPQMKELSARVENGDFADDDGALIRELYTGFDGLGAEGEAAFKEILEGDASGYLPGACVQAYFEQYGEAKQGNFAKRRGR